MRIEPRIARLEKEMVPLEQFLLVCNRDIETPEHVWARKYPEKPFPKGDVIVINTGVPRDDDGLDVRDLSTPDLQKFVCAQLAAEADAAGIVNMNEVEVRDFSDAELQEIMAAR